MIQEDPDTATTDSPEDTTTTEETTTTTTPIPTTTVSTATTPAPTTTQRPTTPPRPTTPASNTNIFYFPIKGYSDDCLKSAARFTLTNITSTCSYTPSDDYDFLNVNYLRDLLIMKTPVSTEIATNEFNSECSDDSIPTNIELIIGYSNIENNQARKTINNVIINVNECVATTTEPIDISV